MVASTSSPVWYRFYSTPSLSYMICPDLVQCVSSPLGKLLQYYCTFVKKNKQTAVDSLVVGSLNETKTKGIKQVLHATRMPPKAFSGAAPPCRT